MFLNSVSIRRDKPIRPDLSFEQFYRSHVHIHKERVVKKASFAVTLSKQVPNQHLDLKVYKG